MDALVGYCLAGTETRNAGAAGLSAALATPVVALAQSAVQRAKTAKPMTPRQPVAPTTPETGAKPPSEFAADAKAMTEVIQRRYGAHLNPAQLSAITEELDSRMQSGKALRALKLANGDEPEVTFHA